MILQAADGGGVFGLAEGELDSHLEARAAGIVSAIGSGDVPSGLRRLELGFLSELHVDAGMGQGDVQPLIRAGMLLEETGDRMASDSRPAHGAQDYTG